MDEARKSAREAYRAERAKWRVSSIPDNIAVPLVDAAIDAYEAALKGGGWVIVPREATPEMLKAEDECGPLVEHGEEYYFRTPEEARDFLEGVWSAMIAASEASELPPAPAVRKG